MTRLLAALFAFIILATVACKTKVKEETTPTKKTVETEKRVAISYQLRTNKDSIKLYLKTLDSNAAEKLADINRLDRKAFANFDTILVPADLTQKTQQYFPFPFYISALADVKKIIFFSYPSQAFAAYDSGMLVRTGATSMGRRADQTPTGLFYTNWKAEQSTSTFNDEWDLKWNFNIENKLGVGFHQYAMPGYPASHSCLRLKEKDAMYLYNWADQWTIKGTDSILAQGTPVIVFGSYPFGKARPWLAQITNPNALLISDTELATLCKNYMPDIMQKQAQRDSVKANEQLNTPATKN